MRLKSVLFSLAAAGMVVAPVAANANPASSLSVASAQRASTPSAKHSNLGGGSAGIYALLIVAGIAAIIAVGASNDTKTKSP
ncbi:hypothetical protein [Sphingomonas sp.]|uniref:hypothetical protein n=1 Tax=Sphingomonas sp. TaxID=28214 RepID=UPI003CC62401